MMEFMGLNFGLMILKSGELSMVSDIADGQSSSLPGYYMSELHGNMLILDATTPEHGTELYSLDTAIR